MGILYFYPVKYSQFVSRLFLLALCSLSLSCQPKKNLEKQTIFGKTMGTYYTVKYIGEENKSLPEEIESLLGAINQSLSTYMPQSTISKVNTMPNGKTLVDDFFIDNFNLSVEINQNTSGSFNPAIMPLVNYWGFGYEKMHQRDQIDSTEVAKLLKICQLSNFELRKDTLFKYIDEAELDFSGIAKGYAVDKLANFLLDSGYKNFIIDIGGENSAYGVNEHQLPWVTGIRMPTVDNNQRKTYIEKLEIKNFSVATSGNYENYYELPDTQIISHTINPETGFPQSLNEEILSSTVISKECSRADAYATAFKVMGLDKSIEVLARTPNLEAFFVFRNQDGTIRTYKSKSKEARDVSPASN